MLRNRRGGKALFRSLATGLLALALLVFAVPATPSFAQASGDVRVRIVKAGLLVGGATGSGILTYRGRNYPFRVSGLSFGITAGATVGRFEGRASGIREVGDFAGSYSSVGGGGAFVGGLGGVHLRNDKGVVIVLQGPKAGMEFAANLSEITISLK
ncbi:hypothetical protein ABIB73_001842 [Bradyrhizobium sp. F1.4.3]